MYNNVLPPFVKFLNVRNSVFSGQYEAILNGVQSSHKKQVALRYL